jgi:hypothetical protein
MEILWWRERGKVLVAVVARVTPTREELAGERESGGAKILVHMGQD